MSVPAPQAPYDPLTAHERDLLFCAASVYLNHDELRELERACAFAFHAHGDQKRKNGIPYITHPIAVTAELAKWRMDLQTLCAGLMHDVLEDTPINNAEMALSFGDVITHMVDGVSKLDKLAYSDKDQHQAESFRKLILAMTKDVRVIVIKLADRLHNMRTLDGVSKIEKRRSTSRETLEIYAPIAHRLGLNHVYRELQDLAFAALHPNRFRVLQQAMTTFRNDHRDVINKVVRVFQERLTGANIEAQIWGREKNLHAIHQKMLQRKVKFEDVQDIYGFQVIVNSVPACYSALGVLHGIFKPHPGRVKDHIAIPKSNSYQSLHTTLTGPYGLPIEVQIRTREMHAVAEAGIAANRHAENNQIGGANQWLQNILDLQARSANAIEFLEHMKMDLYPNEVYVFTPKGKIITLPRGATPVDFAYTIHTDIGNTCVGVRVNKVTVPLRTELKNGDKVDIITQANAKPSPLWLNFVVSSRARSAIRQYIKDTDRTEAIKLGRHLLRRALESILPPHVNIDSLNHLYIEQLTQRQQDWDEVLYQLGLGQILPMSVAMEMAHLAVEDDDVQLGTWKIDAGTLGRVHLCKCCYPVAGDAVRVLSVKGQGIVVHRDTCSVLMKAPTDLQMDADWETFSDYTGGYEAVLVVSSIDTHALLAAMTSAISNAGGNINAVDTLSQAGTEGFIEFRFRLNVRDLTQLQNIMNALQHIPEVRKVSRI